MSDKTITDALASKSIDSVYHKSFPSRANMLELFPSNKNLVNEYYNKWFGDIYKRRGQRPRRFSRFTERVIDRQHQMDLMEMPMDSRRKWTYLLTYIDVASRKGTAVGITNKTTASVLKALKKIYENEDDAVHHLRLPQILQTDGGNEFKGVVDEYLTTIGIEHLVTLEKNHQAIVERFNQTLARPIFRYMDYVEVESGKEGYRFNRWSDVLDNVIEMYNNRVHTTIRAEPARVYSGEVELPPEEVKLPPTDHEELMITGALVRVLIDSSVARIRRATDPIWSREVYMIASSHKKDDVVKYRLLDKDLKHVPKSYYREELLEVDDSKKLSGYTMERYA